MTFELPEHLATFAASVEAIAKDCLAPRAVDRARAGSFPHDAAEMFAEHQVTGLVERKGDTAIPAGVLAGVLAVEAVARHCPRSADAVHAANFAAALHLARFGSNQFHRDQLDRVLSGKGLLAIAVSEESAGSEAAALTTRARVDGDRVVLDGAKRLTANSMDADGFIVYARFGDSVAEIGAVLIERSANGLSFGEPATFMSGERWCPLSFKDLRVPRDNVVFPAGGFTDKAGFFDIEKIGNSARALGLGWCAFTLAKNFAAQRQQFGRTIAEFQGLQWRIAEALLALEAAQLVLYRAADRADRGALRGEDSSCAKVLCNRAAMNACDLAVQIMGGVGYSDDGLADYCFRKARGHMINGGVVELMLTRIAEGVFGRKFPQRVS